MTNKVSKILLANNFVSANESAGGNVASMASVATVFSNFVHYGFTASKELVDVIANYTQEELENFWLQVEPTFKELSFADREMSKFVVYQNFPAEVLNKSEAEYWYAQVLMYVGYDYEFFTEDKNDRPKLKDKKDLKVLKLSDNNSLVNIFNTLISSKVRWNDMQKEHAFDLLEINTNEKIDLSSFGFKENGIEMVNKCLENKKDFEVKDATDVMRLAAAMSNGDISLRSNVRFKKFSRSERKMILSLLDKAKNLESDVAMRQSEWKKFMFQLHPGDYKFKNVQNVYGKLCNGKLKSFNAIVESKIKEGNAQALSLLENRSGDIIRRFHKLYEVFNGKAVDTMVKCMSNFDTLQLLKLKKYIESINTRNNLIYAPNGNWSKAQFVTVKEKAMIEKLGNIVEVDKNSVEVEIIEDLEKSVIESGGVPSMDALMLLKDKLEGKLQPVVVVKQKPIQKAAIKAAKEPMIKEKVKIAEVDIQKLISAINNEMKTRLEKSFPMGVALDEKTKLVKLQTNDQSLSAGYGRGTSFDIPKDITFIRSGSYWQMDSYNNVWFDNGWNFFDSQWNSAGNCCWNAPSLNDAAIFSGDPVISQTEGNKGCQMIDLYIDKLVEQGVRFAVWNLLSYNGISFDDAKDVVATLQMGEQAESGNLYEPSRAQMAFEVKGQNKTKYIAYVDLVDRKIVYLDANLQGNLSSAVYNSGVLSERMPAVVEYLDTLPSVYDLFEAVQGGTVPVIYSDKDIELKVEKAYVFKHQNPDNEFEFIDINSLLKK